MKKINYIIVDDEQWARDMLELYTQKITGLHLVAKCKNTEEAKAVLIAQKIDLLFLDIQMPGQSGVDFLEQLPDPPMVIFTTAYSDYALKGYELEVIDYLLKPVSFERFEIAVQKAIYFFHKTQKANAFDEIQSFEDQHIFIKDSNDLHKLFLKDILFIEGMKEYVRYHTLDKKLMELRAMKDLEKTLPETHFLRIHRSYIIAKNQVTSQVKHTVVLTDGTILPIGKTYRQGVLGQLM